TFSWLIGQCSTSFTVLRTLAPASCGFASRICRSTVFITGGTSATCRERSISSIPNLLHFAAHHMAQPCRLGDRTRRVRRRRQPVPHGAEDGRICVYVLRRDENRLTQKRRHLPQSQHPTRRAWHRW